MAKTTAPLVGLMVLVAVAEAKNPVIDCRYSAELIGNAHKRVTSAEYVSLNAEGTIRPVGPTAEGARPVAAARPPYDPSAVPQKSAAHTVDTVVHDRTRKREIPIRIYLPAAKTAAAVILFSHGLGGSRQGSAYLGRHWAARG